MWKNYMRRFMVYTLYRALVVWYNGG